MTGWTFEEIENTPAKELELLLLFKNIKKVAIEGGDYQP